MRTHRRDDLELVRRFVNTRDVEGGTDDLETARGLRDWLRAHGLRVAQKLPTEADRSRAVALREALRVLLVANGGEAVDTRPALRVLDGTAERSCLCVRFGAEGGRLEPRARGLDAALGRILAAVVTAMADGTWGRLKACGREECRWAFYDRARNRSRRWCSMAECGNVMKARAYRRRHG